jgi:hypothetical protein
MAVAPASCASSDHVDLRARAARDGEVRVIVTLRTDGAAPPTAAAIRDAQERLVAALQGTRYAGVRLYQNVPQLALTAGPDALEALFASPLVAAVQADALAKPMSPGAR